MLRAYQSTIKNDIVTAHACGHQNVLAVMPTGAGKCLGRGTPVLMYDGTIRAVETIIPGEYVMGPDSQPRLVVSTTSGVEQLYRIMPKKGDPYIVNESHILSLRKVSEKNDSSFPSRHGGQIINVPVYEYLNWSKYKKHIHKGWRTSIDFSYPTFGLNIEPYLMGLWLGDGNSKGFSITVGNLEILDYLKSLPFKYRIENNTDNSIIFHIKDRQTHFLRCYNVIDNKHIPNEYKFASREIRLKLLAGLLDADGHMSKNCFDLTLKSEKLIDDVIFVARSLGFAAHKKSCQKICTNNGVVGNYFRTSITGDVSKIPTKIKSKQATSRRQKKNVLNVGIKIEPIGIGEYFGFEIQGNDRLFVLGDFTVTHNTVVMADIVKSDQSSPQILIAHRQELVGQISMALARAGVYHRIVAPQSTIRFIIDRHVAKFGESFEHPNAPVAVAGVDTLIRRTDQLEQFLKQCTRWQTDEAHHLQTDNKWGMVVSAIPNAFGIGWTATPLRPAGQSLGRLRSGVFDYMVVGPSMRDLIRQGYLCDYKIFGPPSDIDTSDVSVSSSTGDYNSKQLRDAAHRSHITGDIVAHYLRLAAGKRGVTFAVDVALAEEHAAAFRQAGVPAAVLHAKTPDRDRVSITDRFERGEILQIVNVDVLGEGYDCPAIEVVQFARPTQSYGLFVQQFGRGLRPLPGKSHGLIIDHVGNVSGPRGHGLPDAHREWSLDGDARNTRPTDDLPCRTCPECWAVFEGYGRTCPECGYTPERAPKSRPELVEGDLTEFTPELLARLRGEVDRIIQPCPFVPTDAKTGKQAQLWTSRLTAQEDLRTAIAWWAGVRRDVYGDSDAESYRRFWRTFSVDVLTAQTLDGTKSAELAERIWAVLPVHVQEQRRSRSPDVAVEGVKNKLELYIERFMPVVSLNRRIMVELAPDLFKNDGLARGWVGTFKNETGRYRYAGGNLASKYYAPGVDIETVRAELSKLHDGLEITFDVRNTIDIYIERFLPVVSLNPTIMARLASDLFKTTKQAISLAGKFKNETGRYRYPGSTTPSKYYAPDVDPETVRAELSKLHDGAEITLLSSDDDTESEAA